MYNRYVFDFVFMFNFVLHMRVLVYTKKTVFARFFTTRNTILNNGLPTCGMLIVIFRMTSTHSLYMTICYGRSIFYVGSGSK